MPKDDTKDSPGPRATSRIWIPEGTEEGDPLRGTPYRTIRLLAVGGMSEIYEIASTASGEIAVAKIMRDASRRSKRTRDRMRLEWDILRAVHEPKPVANVIRALDTGVTCDNLPYIVLERLDGHTLQWEAGERGTLPLFEALDLVRQALEGLSHLHALGVVHRDLKPGNLFVCRPKKGQRLLKIIDLGLAKVLKGTSSRLAPLVISTADETFVGTHRYTAPEQADPRTTRSVDRRADVYTLGLVLYLLLCGREPYYDVDERSDLLQAHVNRAIALPSDDTIERFSPELVAIMMKALAKDRDARFASALEFAATLDRFLRKHRPERPAIPGKLSPTEHARMTAELELYPSQEQEIRARYGVSTSKAWRVVQTWWESQVASNPKLKKLWSAEVERCRLELKHRSPSDRK